MSYTQKTLMKDEKIIYQGKISLWTHWFLIGAGILLAVPTLGFTLLLLLIPYIDFRTSELAITNKRVVAKFGLIRRRTFEVSLSKVDSLEVDQGIMGRIFNYGDMVFMNAGGRVPIPGVKDPLMFRRQVIQAQEAKE